jgi:hypothetical protein
MVMKKSQFFDRDFGTEDFPLKSRDAYDTAKNIDTIFTTRAGWFQTPKSYASDGHRLV